MQIPHTCIYCKGKLEEGTLAGDGATWRKTKLFGKGLYKLLGAKIVKAYRCVNCGNLQLVAED